MDSEKSKAVDHQTAFNELRKDILNLSNNFDGFATKRLAKDEKEKKDLEDKIATCKETIASYVPPSGPLSVNLTAFRLYSKITWLAVGAGITIFVSTALFIAFPLFAIFLGVSSTAS